MTTSGKKIRISQPVKQVTVDASILPKSGVGASVAAAGEAKVNIVAPVGQKVAAVRQKIRQQSVKAAVDKIEAAVEAGTVSAADAKMLVLTLAMRRVGSKDAAEAWYRGQRVEAFNGRTPAQMVRAGELKTLLAFMKAEASQAQATKA